jgi:hypothetical protein
MPPKKLIFGPVIHNGMNILCVYLIDVPEPHDGSHNYAIAQTFPNSFLVRHFTRNIICAFKYHPALAKLIYSIAEDCAKARNEFIDGFIMTRNVDLYAQIIDLTRVLL